MGYNLHIIRKEGNQVSLKEWLDYIESNAEFSVETEEYITGVNPITGKEIKIKGDPTTGYWNHEGEGIPFSFDETYGIDVKNPDDNIVLKMLEIANEFEAIVEGDDGEVYNALYFENRVEWEKQQFPDRFKISKPWWKFW